MFSVDREGLNLINAVTACVPDKFGLYYNDNDDDESANEDFFDSLHIDIKYSTPSPLSFSVEHGVSKMAIVAKDLDYVIKVPFTGIWRGDWENAEDEEYYTFEPLHGFKYGNDYCDAEYILYQKAKEAGLSVFFAETEKFDDNVYLQEKVTPASFDDFKASAESISNSEEICIKEDIFICDDVWCAIACEKYGEELFSKFLNFCKEYKLNEDMHSGNYGYRRNGEPCLFDTSSWHH